MALPTQVISIPIAGGLMEGVDDRVVEPGSWLTIDNLIYTQAGALRKRHGYGYLSQEIAGTAGAVVDGADHLDSLNGQLVAIGYTVGTNFLPRVRTFSPAFAAWADQGSACPASIARLPQTRSPISVDIPHIALAGGVSVAVWYVGGAGLLYKATDAASGTVLVDETVLTAGSTRQTMFAVGDDIVHICLDGADFVARTFDTSTLTWSAPTVLYTPPLVTVWDACPVGTTSFAIAFHNAALAGVLLEVWTVSTMVMSSSLFQATGVIISLSINANATHIGIVAGTIGLDVYAFVATIACVLTGGPTAIYLAMAALTGTAAGFDSVGRLVVLWDGEIVATQPLACLQKMSTAGVLVGPRRDQYFAKLWSKPFAQDGLTYTLLSGAALVCLDDTTSAARPWTLCGSVAVSETTAGIARILGILLPRPLPQPWLADGQWAIPLLVRTGPGSLPGLSVLAVDRIVLDYRRQQQSLWLTAKAQNCLTTTGGLAAWFDGQSMTELGFMFPPDILSAVVLGGGGSIEGAGVAPNENKYLYTAFYEWLDEQGNTHRSAAAVATEVAVSLANTNASVTLTLRNLHFTRKGNVDNGVIRLPTIAVYRTEKNSPDIFYRVSPPATTVAATLISDPTVWATTFADTLSDAQLLAAGYGQIILPEQGGPLDNDWPPATTAVVTHKNRMWLASAEDDRVVWYSKSLIRNEGPGFSVFSQLRVDDSPDGITGLASLDDKLVVFTRSRVYYIIGDGPADTGQNGFFSDPVLVTANAGCIDPRSVVTYDEGVVFQSKGGFYLLNRALQVGYLGMPVQTTLDAYNEVLAVSHDPDRSWLIWLCRGPSPLEVGAFVSVFLVYDYLHKAWLSWSVDDADSQISQTMWEGQHVWSNTSRIALESVADTILGYDPDDTWITSTLATPWFKFAGIGGYQRCRHVVLTGRVEGPHTLTANVYTDFSTTTTQTQTWDSATLGGLPEEHLDLHVKRQKASAMKVVLSDSEPNTAVGGLGQGFSLAGLSLEVGVKLGRDKLPAANRK